MWRVLYILHLTLALSSSQVDSLYLQLFDSPNFFGPYATVNETEGCTNLTTNFIQEARSLKTDSCIMIFKDYSCTNHSYRLDSGHYPDLLLVKHDTVSFRNPLSYRLCSEEEGGSTVNVDIYGFASTLGDPAPPYQGLLLEYRDVCSCINLPTKGSYFANVTHIHNYGNCIILYSEPGCTGDKIQLLGGVSAESLDLSTHPTSFRIPQSSIGLCEPRPPCHTLNSTIYKFVLSIDEQRAQEISTSTNQAMKMKTTFHNNGTAIQTQIYEAKTTIREVIEVTRATKFSTTNNTYSTTRTVKTEGLYSWWFLYFRTTVTETLTEAYTVTNTSEDAYEEKHIRDESREISVRQELTIPPCSSYKVDSYITMVQNYPVNYEVYMYVGGMSKDRRLDAREVKERLPEGLVYVEEFDDFTVIAKGNGTILAGLSMEAVVEGEGSKLEGCLADTNSTYTDT